MNKIGVLLILGMLTLTGACTPQGAPPTPGATATLEGSPPPRATVPLQVTSTPKGSASPSIAPPSQPPHSTSSPTPIPCDPAQIFCFLPDQFTLQRPFIPPANDKVDAGYRYGSTQREKRQPHHGVEFYNATGTPVLATADGVVVVAGNDESTVPYSPWHNFYGNLVVLEHHLPGLDEPVYTLYAHLSEVGVTMGQTVAAGERIGAVGMTGGALGSHLHLEVRLGGNTYASSRNPELWLQPRQGEGVLAVKIVNAQGKPVEADLQVTDAAGVSIAPEPYHLEVIQNQPEWAENYVVGDLPEGAYRLSFIYWGRVFERQIEVMPGKLTLVIFNIP